MTKSPALGLPAKLLGALPPGVRLVVGGTVVLGASSYIFLAATRPATARCPPCARSCC
ncbi:hypothetical protein [Kitasatospora sp. P5_F3]